MRDKFIACFLRDNQEFYGLSNDWADTEKMLNFQLKLWIHENLAKKL
jgi:hypothetical protein